jgi:membrane protease YdiL (CAAX protease family)
VPTTVFDFIAPLVTLAVACLAMAGGCAAIVRQPRILHWLLRPEGRRPVLAVVALSLGGLLASAVVLGIVALAVWPWACERDHLRTRRPLTDWTFIALLIAALSWSLAWIVVVSFVDAVKVQEDFMFENVSPLLRPFEWVFVLGFAVALAIIEEAIYRGGVQQAVEKWSGRPWLGIVVASAVWALAHGGYVEPFGVKEFQIFLLGVLIGVAANRHGLRGAIAIHVANNLMGVGLTFLEQG